MKDSCLYLLPTNGSAEVKLQLDGTEGASTDVLSSTRVLTLTSRQSESGRTTVPRLASLRGSGAAKSEAVRRRTGWPAPGRTPNCPRRHHPRELCKRLTRHCPNHHFPLSSGVRQVAANSSTLVARSTPSTGSRGRGSQVQ
ncbi:hypothetical protein Taro_021125 [Colocasia esculenta]|uniref:Uncharacterized protein n=1 Tax=Colocasia esculenta TaxID=4460 RepID=A0A843UY46_COLES|nr:hypothetical protein [Colocasia esculenta]